MNCEECRELMLEADSDLLTGIGDGPLAAHIRLCEACRELASAMLGHLSVTRAAYSRIEPVSRPPRHASRFTARRAVWAVATLAAAAAVLIVVASKPSPVQQHLVWRNLEPDSTAATIAVEVPEGKNAIVFDTNNPQISVVWIY